MTSPDPLLARDLPGGCTLPVRVHPGARKNSITGVHAGAIKVSLTTPPTDGRANEALIALLSDLLRLPRANIRLLTGATSRTKLLHITGKTAAQVQSTLLPGTTT